MSREHVRFPGSQGGTLVGRLEGPATGEPVAYALFAHCFTCSKDLRSAGGICRELTARGFGVLRFDFTGIGESEGEFADTNFSSNVQDLIAAADFLRGEGRAPALLVGHSLGGTAMLAAAGRIPEAVAVATIGAPSDTRHLHRKLAARLGGTGSGAAGREGRTAESEAAGDGKTPAGREAAGQAPMGTGGAGQPAAGTEGAGKISEETEAANRRQEGTGEAGRAAEAEEADGGDAGDSGVTLDLGGPRPVRVRRQLLADLAEDHLRDSLAHLGKGLLIFHSPVDRVVGIDHAERLFLEARHPKSFVSLGSADHLLSDPRDAAHVGAVLAAWAGRYLETGADAGAAAQDGTARTNATAAQVGTAEAGTAPAAAMEGTASPSAAGTAAQEGTADPGAAAAAASAGEGAALPRGVVEVTGHPHSLLQEVRSGRHVVVADEPVAEGGADAGPTPYALLLGALGACTAMTLRLYAERKQLPLGEVRVRLRHFRDHARDCAECGKSDARIERIERDLELGGALTEGQTARLLEIADRCPVHRTLSSRVEIVTRLR